MTKLLKRITPPILYENINRFLYNRSLVAKRARLARHSRLHLACGPNILAGWGNIDLKNSSHVVGLNLTKPLPVDSSTISYIFTEHFIEHIEKPEALSLLRECYRVLIPGGVIRITTPSLEKLLSAYTLNDLTEWADVDWMPNSGCDMINEGFRNWGHRYIYDSEALSTLVRDAGFQALSQAEWRQSSHSELRNLECRPFHHEIVIEAKK